MKKRKMMAALAAMVLVTGVTFACSKDKDENKDTGGDSNVSYPKTLTFQNPEIKEFVVYVGTAEGGKQVNVSVGTYFDEIIDKSKGDCVGKTYHILNASEMRKKTDGEIFQYKFENNTLYFLDKDDPTEWDREGYGNAEKIYVEKNHYIIKKGTQQTSETRQSEYFSQQNVLDLAGISSFLELTNPADTIMWCKVEYSWK